MSFIRKIPSDSMQFELRLSKPIRMRSPHSPFDKLRPYGSNQCSSRFCRVSV